MKDNTHKLEKLYTRHLTTTNTNMKTHKRKEKDHTEKKGQTPNNLRQGAKTDKHK